MTISGIGTSAAATAVDAPQKLQQTSDAVKAGEGFEKMLLGQLTTQLVDSAMPDNPESSAASSTYKQMLPDALTEALMSGGGIGLAQQLAAATNEKASS
jgi:Rod binding domain-containing protein